MRNTLLAIALGLALLGCSRHTELIDDGSIPGLERLEITPSSTDVVIDDLTATRRVALRAIGHFAKGETRDVTDRVSWGVDNHVPGDFVAPGDWQSSNRAGGLVHAEARAGSVAADVAIAVHFEPVIVDPSFPPAPGAADLFDPNTPVLEDPASSPSIVYPADGVMLPINLYRTLFQFDPAGSPDVFRIRFESSYLDLSVLTTNDRWQAEDTTWDYLALSAAGDTATMTVSAVDSSDPAAVFRSQPVELGFSGSAVRGAIYYWSSTSEGILKGSLSDPAPERFYTQAPDTTCVGCHTISRDGTRMALAYDDKKLQEISVPGRDVLIGDDRGYASGWSTFNPDASRLLVAHGGALRLLDAATGEEVGDPIDLGGQQVTHPDWSPLGDYVAVAACTRADNDKDVEGCSIARIPVNGDELGELEVLVAASGPGDNNYFPRYSPDGAWIAYVNAEGKSRDQPKAALRLVPAGGGDPIALEVASSRVGPAAVGETGSTMPTWAPATHAGVQWLVFSSIRDYGKVLVGDKADQLWIAAIDTGRAAAAGADPSFAAFWLPLQDLGEDNHRAFWALDSAVDETCGPEVCDGYDNDCDGEVDEACQPCGEVEICVDGIDNDCDGRIDEGCIQ